MKSYSPNEFWAAASSLLTPSQEMDTELCHRVFSKLAVLYVYIFTHCLAYRDADWNLKDIQQHLVRTQRQQTANNKAFLGHIQRLDSDIEDLMKQVWFI